MSTETQAPGVSLNDFVDELVVALMNTRIYWSDHPRVNASITELTRILPDLLEELGTGDLEIQVADDQLVHDRRPLIGASLAAPRLIKSLGERDCGGLVFKQGVTEADYRAALQILVDRADPGASAETLNAEMERQALSGIRFLEALELGDQSAADRAGRVSRHIYQSMVENLQDTTVSLCHGGKIQFESVQTIVEQVLTHLDEEGPSGLMSATRYEQYDAYTFGHCVRVSVLALTFARTLTSDESLLNRIGVAAMLHDVGKVRVPFEILHCKNRLDDDQRKEMENHTTYGAEILLDHDGCDPMAWSAAFGHHLEAEGGGYPKLVHEPEVSIVTSIVKICDVFEALTAERPYKAGMSPARAFRIMMGMGDAFDRGLLGQFIRAIGVYPAGMKVKLSTGEHATVVGQTGDPLRPTVAVETTPDGFELDEESKFDRDLTVALDKGTGCASCVIEAVLQKIEVIGS